MADMRVFDYENQSWVELRGTPDGALLASVPQPLSQDEEVLAAASDVTFGKIATIANTATVYVRCSSSNRRQVDWRVKSDQQHTVQKYRARSIVDSVGLAFSSFVDTNTAVVNGVTYTGEETPADAAYASRKFVTGVTDTADAAAFAALVNADYAVTTAGTSVATEDILTITTDEGVHTITAAATADYPEGEYGLSSTVGTELASIIAAINHKDNVTLASVTAGDTVTINGCEFTAHASTTTTSKREFSIAGNNDADAAALVTCINDATYGVPGVTATAASNVVSLTRDALHNTVTLTTSNTTRLATESAGGVPGVIAAATGATGELSITPTWTTVLSVKEDGDQLTVTDIDSPGIYATASEGTATLVPLAMASGGAANFIQATAAANCTPSQVGTLSGLVLDGSPSVDVAANSTTAGTLYEHTPGGWEYCYLALTNKSGSAAATVVVGATAF